MPLRRTLALTAALLATAFVGVALAKTFTLKVHKNAKVVNAMTQATTHANIVVTSHGFAVYTLTGDSAKHPKCNNAGCWMFWPPVKVKSTKGLSAAKGIKGKLGTWRHHGFLQLTIAGHPVYRWYLDTANGPATGDCIQSFGGTWHVRTPSGKWVMFAAAGGGPGWP